MNSTDLYRDYSVEQWRKYRPWEPQYANFLPHELLAGFKIEDVYRQFSNARASLLFMESDNYGDLITTDDTSLRFIRSKFLFDALANYNYCIDLSWQVCYLYYGQEDYGMLQDRQRYERATKECTEESLRCRMVNLAQETEKYNFLLSFFHAPLTMEIREAYNYIKHRGTFHIDGLGMNDDKVPIGLDGSTLRMINREEISLDEWKQKLMTFDLSFYDYFNHIIAMTMPSNFTDTSYKFDDLVGMMFRLKKWEQNS